MEPTFENAKVKLEKHLRILISQPIQEFQEQFDYFITSVNVELIDVSTVSEKLSLVKSVKITIQS